MFFFTKIFNSINYEGYKDTFGVALRHARPQPVSTEAVARNSSLRSACTIAMPPPPMHRSAIATSRAVSRRPGASLEAVGCGKGALEKRRLRPRTGQGVLFLEREREREREREKGKESVT